MDPNRSTDWISTPRISIRFVTSPGASHDVPGVTFSFSHRRTQLRKCELPSARSARSLVRCGPNVTGTWLPRKAKETPALVSSLSSAAMVMMICGSGGFKRRCPGTARNNSSDRRCNRTSKSWWSSHRPSQITTAEDPEIPIDHPSSLSPVRVPSTPHPKKRQKCSSQQLLALIGAKEVPRRDWSMDGCTQWFILVSLPRRSSCRVFD
jgi:hypothetical protein